MMQYALDLAARGLYTTHPNPRVGCVIVQADKVVSEGWHIKAGEPHAEVHALQDAGERARGATAYVTLEPCAHTGRTPPCVDALIKAGIKRVVYAMQDPNPMVNGQGLERLQAAKIQVDGPVCELEARELNSGFIKRMESGLPLVRIKMAMSVDGRTALADGSSKWITNEASREDVHHWRARSSAILTGVGTVLADDPQLNVRLKNMDLHDRQPWRVICDTHLRTPSNSRVVQTAGALIYTTTKPYACGNAEVVQVNVDEQGKLDLMAVLRELAIRGCNEVLVEAGATLGGALLARGLADELLIYIAPILLGQHARALFDLPIISHMSERPELQLLNTQQFGSDIRLRYRVIRDF